MRDKVYEAEKVFESYDFDGEVEEVPDRKIYHVTGWDELRDLKPGDSFLLKPGKHNAQGKGVYFSETLPRISAADYLVQNNKDPVAIIEIFPREDEDWYKSKEELVKKFRKPRTWHTNGKDLQLVVLTRNIVEIEGLQIPILHCAYYLKD